MKKKSIYGILAVFVLYGFVLRVYQVGQQSLWLDEAASVMCSQSIAQYGVPALPSGITSWSAFPYHYLMAVPIWLGLNAQTIPRLISVLMGTILIILQYFLARKCSKSDMVGLLAAFLTAFLAFEVAWSRQIRFYLLLQVLLAAGTLQFIKFTEKRRFFELLASLFCLIAAILTHRSGYLLGLIFALSVLFNGQKMLNELKNRPKMAFLTIAGLIFVLGGLFGALFMLKSSSSLLQTFQMLLRPSKTDYSLMYGRFLYEQMGWTLLLVPVGMLIGIKQNRSLCVPIVISCLAYFYVISFRTWLFAFRYLLPILPFLLIFVAQNAIFVEKLVKKAKKWQKIGQKSQKIIKISLFCLFFAIFAFPMNLVFNLQKEHWLGYTAPQPRWKEAFALISDREKQIGGPQSSVITVSAFPMFHDLYLGSCEGQKYYLPISHTGFHQQIQRNAPYAAATTIHSLEELLAINGYLILDDFSLRMLADPEIQNYLTQHRYNAYLPGRFNIYIWILNRK